MLEVGPTVILPSLSIKARQRAALMRAPRKRLGRMSWPDMNHSLQPSPANHPICSDLSMLARSTDRFLRCHAIFLRWCRVIPRGGCHLRAVQQFPAGKSRAGDEGQQHVSSRPIRPCQLRLRRTVAWTYVEISSHSPPLCRIVQELKLASGHPPPRGSARRTTIHGRHLPCA